MLANTSVFPSDLYYKKYFTDDQSKSKYLLRMISELKQHFQFKHEIICDREINEADQNANRVDRIHEISLKGDDERIILQFRWLLEYGKWKLYDIFITSNIYCN